MRFPSRSAARRACGSGRRPEPGARDAIAAATTEPRFLSPWVADVPDSPTVPSPSKFLGHVAGAPGELTRTEKIYAYFRALAAATPRVRVETIGKSEEGREIVLAIVGDEKNLSRLDALKADMAALADPRRTDEAAMERIVSASPPFYMLHGGLHSAETGSPEMLMELAYRLAVSDAPHVREVREQRRGPHQPGGRARRPRPRGGLVLPRPQGPDGLRPAAARARRRTGARTSATTTTATASRGSSP